MDFLEKLDFLMERFDLTKTSLSQKSGIPYTTIDAWYKKGYEGLKLTTLRKLASYFNTTLDYWFLDEITDPNYGKSSGFKVEYTEMEHIKKYRSLDPHGQQTVDIILDRELKRSGQLLEAQERIAELKAQASAPDTIASIVNEPVPDYLVVQAAHNDSEIDDEELGKMQRDIEWLKKRHK